MKALLSRHLSTQAGHKPGSVTRRRDHLSGTTVTRRLTRSTRSSNGTGRPSLLLDLAPGGGCLAARVTTRAGGLLHHLFTITGAAAPPRLSAFLWPSSVGLPRLGVTQHHALWSPDFPPPAVAGSDRLADLGYSHHSTNGQPVKASASRRTVSGTTPWPLAPPQW